MTIFPFRLVLFDGTVIMPDEIFGIELFGTDAIQIELHDGRCYIPLRCEVRPDLATGMKDSTGKEIYERDMYGAYVVLRRSSGLWILSAPNHNNDDWHGLSRVCATITITGHVPFGEE